MLTSLLPTPIYISTPTPHIRLTFLSSLLVEMEDMELRLELSLSTRPDPPSNRKRAFAHTHSPFSNRNGGSVVGWPPVRSWRKQLCHRNRRVCATNYVNVENGGGGGWRAANSVYVKVKMEGVGITRKIDLSFHRSHRTLATNLIDLFGKSEENVAYKLMYQNKEDEWLQAGDVPWECFIKSARRLKLEKNGNSS
ncbi:auxin-induced protein IAA6-like [Salvia miltiorrhiza]|uniref:auxin-induced protein IAA6-like n=1 Tax=Salvia miltiorrhiza TaxID=226208 RepID=UPI0025ABD769|nr:auxin-induced protein IAA6-like [Salvia miltiorrhiza]